MRSLLLAILVAFSAAAFAQGGEPLIGNWRLVSRQTIVDGVAAPPDVFGLDPKGYLILTREGRMALIITGENRSRAG
jgi:Lipocalin-like domain